MATHELVTFPNGSASVRPILPGVAGALNEAMHSHIGPWEEAQHLYVGQSRLRELLAQPGPALVIYDVGMGIAANALAALACREALGPQARRELEIVSFERDLDGLRTALAQPEHFGWMRAHREKLVGLLLRRDIAGPGWRWRVHEGDFLATDLGAFAAAEFVYFDFYSPKATPELWTAECFARLRAACAPTAQLWTYCASTSARAAMLLGGFYVGQGAATDAKSETTVAACRLEDLTAPLPPAWLDKLARSARPLPTDWDTRPDEAADRLREHAQFRATLAH